MPRRAVRAAGRRGDAGVAAARAAAVARTKRLDLRSKEGFEEIPLRCLAGADGRPLALEAAKEGAEAVALPEPRAWAAAKVALAEHMVAEILNDLAQGEAECCCSDATLTFEAGPLTGRDVPGHHGFAAYAAGAAAADASPHPGVREQVCSLHEAGFLGAQPPDGVRHTVYRITRDP